MVFILFINYISFLWYFNMTELYELLNENLYIYGA